MNIVQTAVIVQVEKLVKSVQVKMFIVKNLNIYVMSMVGVTKAHICMLVKERMKDQNLGEGETQEAR